MVRTIARVNVAALEHCNRRFSAVGTGPVWDEITFPWLVVLNQAAAEILEEFDRYVDGGRHVPEINETDPGASKLYGTERWEMLHLFLMSAKLAAVCAYFPRTLALLESIPQMRHAKFSILGADRHHVPRHRDSYNGVLRMHLPLRVPSGNCYIDIAGQRMDWKPGHAFVFDPGMQHEVFKEAAESRVILIADFLRPAPDWLRHWSERHYRRLGRSPQVQSVIARYHQIFGVESAIERVN